MMKLIEFSPGLALMGFLLWNQNKHYTKLVEDTRVDGKQREDALQAVIHKNQEIILDLGTKFNVVEKIESKVDRIERQIEKVLK